ncbi:MAG: hypothetical protein BECKG1743E_GA0114224_108413 [Candidatus Kentron sp. G]|nr:MAG: hypothetical protein BECKG1743E_GA0114224_108413 [Candidatus Kentron sp. G]
MFYCGKADIGQNFRKFSLHSSLFASPIVNYFSKILPRSCFLSLRTPKPDRLLAKLCLKPIKHAFAPLAGPYDVAHKNHRETTMPYQNIDASLSPEDIQAIKDAVDTIIQKLPFLVNLTPKERKSLFKAGPDGVSFLQNALNAAQDHPTIFPASFRATEFKRDVDLFTTLTDIGIIVASLASEIDDTRIAVGSEAMQEASQIYTYVKAAAKTYPLAINHISRTPEKYHHPTRAIEGPFGILLVDQPTQQ